MHILDTDTLTHLHKGNERVKMRLAAAKEFDFAITIVYQNRDFTWQNRISTESKQRGFVRKSAEIPARKRKSFGANPDD